MLVDQDNQVHREIEDTVEQSFDVKQKVDEALEVLRGEKSRVEKQLKDATKARNEFLIKREMQNLKNQWDKSNNWEVNRKLYHDINKVKERRNTLVSKVYELQVMLRGINSELYHTKNKKSTKAKERVVIKPENYRCLMKDEKCCLHKQLVFDDIAISGTDNGIVSMTETSSCTMEKFKFHLELFIYIVFYKMMVSIYPLKSKKPNSSPLIVKIEFDDFDEKMAFLPKTITTKSKEVKYRSGGYRNERSLARREKATDK
jgi:hypothetical protein